MNAVARSSRIPQIGRNRNHLPERTFKQSNSLGKPLVGSILVLLSAGFLLLTMREGDPHPYQRLIDSVFHNWMAMAAFAFVLWTVRRDWFGNVPGFFRFLGGFLFLFFVVFAAIALVVWPPLWSFLRLFHVSQYQVQPIAAFAVVGLWFVGCIALLVRRFIRWMGKRYQHHGVAVGFGPLYFYFRRRRAS
jgi:hypothetical protein